MIQNPRHILGFKDKKTGEFVTFDDAEFVQHKNGTFTVRGLTWPEVE